MSVLTYDGAWQRPDGTAETDADQHVAGRSSSQPSRLADEHQPKDCFQGLAEVHEDVVLRRPDLDAQRRPHFERTGC